MRGDESLHSFSTIVKGFMTEREREREGSEGKGFNFDVCSKVVKRERAKKGSNLPNMSSKIEGHECESEIKIDTAFKVLFRRMTGDLMV